MKKISPNSSLFMQKRNFIRPLLVAMVLSLWSLSLHAANYYTFTNGDWGTASTWTTDPTGLTSVGAAVPGASDNIFIVNARSVFTTTPRTVLSATVANLGILDLGTSISHDLGTVTGQGKIIISAGTFPAGDFTDFVSSTGGTIEYRDVNGTLPDQLVYNNLIVSNTGASVVTSSLPNLSSPTNYTVNGSLSISSSGAGLMQFNLGSAPTNIINLNVFGDVTVALNAAFGVSSFNAVHNLFVSGSFSNDGTVDFSNALQYQAPLTGAIILTFNGVDDEVFSINGTTDVYSITVNKGTDFNSELEMVSTNSSFFRFLSEADALTLTSGTLRWGNNMSQNRINSGGLFTIPGAARLWISGGDMLLDGSVGGVLVDGTFRITSGNFSAGFEGMLFGLTGAIVVEGGVTTIEKLRPQTIAGTHVGTLTMSGGVLNVDGSTLGSGDAGSPRFSIPYPDMGFFVTGGVINVANPESGTAANGGIFIGVNVANTTVTSGTVNVSFSGSGANFNINSSVPLFSLTATKTSLGAARLTLGSQAFGSAYNQTYFTSPIAGTALVVKRDLNLTTGNDLEFAANGINVSVGRNFTINTGTTYTPGTNTTIFNGAGTQLFTLNGNITSGLHNLTVSKGVAQSVVLSGAAGTLNILNTLNIVLGSFNSGGKQVLCSGNISNNGTCLGTGAIQLVGTGAQVISGSGSGIFTNLTLNKASGSATMTANFQISGLLRLGNASGVLDIGNKVLFFTAGAKVYDDVIGTSTANFSSTRMIRTNGLFSDGGIRKNYNLANSSFIYAFGSAGKYTPATITLTGTPTTYGFIFIRPVNERHPVATSDEAIPYFWRTNSTGFVLGSATCQHTYRYADADAFTIAPGTEADYVPAKFTPSLVSWSIGNVTEVDEATNTVSITVPSFGGEIDGEYTTGAQIPEDPFANVISFYSIRNGIWEDTDTATTPWSVRGHDGDPTDLTPGPRNPVLIGDGAGFVHTVTSGANGEKAGYLFIGQNSTLDVGSTINHDFSVANGFGITGTGNLKISSSASTAVFPGGDFGVFLSATGGNVEYYTTTISFNIPVTTGAPDFLPLETYNNLTVSPTSGFTITMPDLDLTVLKTYKISGSPLPSSGIVRLNSASPRTLNVNGLFQVNSGEVVFLNNAAQTVNAKSNVTIANGGAFRVNGSGTAVNNTITITAALTNNGVFDMSESGRICDVKFIGNANRTLGGTNASAVTEFNKLTIDKGPSPERTLDVTVAGSLVTPSNDWLFMVNGGIRISKAVTLTLSNSTTPFSLPVNTQLTLNNAGAQVLIGQSSSNSADFSLGGKLVLINGSLNVGIAGSNNNQDIEYATVGAPEIDVRNTSTLFVNGQIRRSLGTTDGNLIYRQSGNSVVEIVGANPNNSRAKLEILNPLSSFNFSDNASIIIRRGGGTVFGDVFLQPSSSAVTGGTITFATQNIGVNQQFTLESSVALNNIITNGLDGNDQSTLRLLNSALTINGSLTISNDNSVFNANGKGLIMKGNLVNNNTSAAPGLTAGGFRPGNATQVTQFNGSTGNQTITGILGNQTNFANLVIDNTAPSGTVSLVANTNLRVQGVLSLSNGIFQDGGNTVLCSGEIINNSVHQSTGSGNITCNGPLAQNISGNGSGRFGRLVINNLNNVTTSSTVTVDENLDLQFGVLNIRFYLLKLTENCTVTGAFSGSRMILTNGTPSDSGVMKMFPAGANNFEFPIGTSVFFTPVTYNITANTAPGTIRVNPVAIKHPATTLAADEQLNYFWSVESTGFAGLTVDHLYQYRDVFVTGTESNYVTGRYVFPQWDPTGGISGTVDQTNNTMQLTGVNFIQGEYTCGDPLEFQEVDTLYSRDATLGGAWDDVNTWSTVGHAGPAASVIPSFQIVFVKAGHTVNTNGDSRSCSVLINDGVVDTEDDSQLIFGIKQGTGRLRISSNGTAFNFPTGNFNAFNSVGGGTVEYYGSVDGLMATSPFYNNLEFTGSSAKTMGDVPFTVNGNLLISSGSFKADVFNEGVSIRGNWINNVGSTGYVAGQNEISFSGVNQNIGGTGSTNFYDIELANSGTKTLGNNIDIDNDLTINTGVTFDVSTSNFNVALKHDWINNGTFNARSGNVDLNGTSLQTLQGNTVTQFFNLTQNNIFDVVLGTDQSLQNTLTVVSGDFITTPKDFTLLSTLTRTARIAPLTVGTVQGSIIQQRLAPGPTTGWALLGAPVSGQTILQWMDDFFASGFIGANTSAGGFISIYTYDEADLGAFGSVTSYVPITNAFIDPISPGIGYWVYLGTGSVTTANILIDVKGPVVSGDFVFNPTFSSSGSLPDDGWTLIANPYPSAIDWDSPTGWSRTNLDDAIYIFNADIGAYAAYVAGASINGGVAQIGSSQGFYVKANAASPSLSCTEQVKTAANPTFVRQGRPSVGNSSEIIRMTLSGNGKNDEAVVRFHSEATANYDSRLDAFKWNATDNSIASVSTLSNESNLSINSLPSDFSTLSIPVKVLAGIEGEYSLNFQGIELISGISCAVLEDLKTGQITDLKNVNQIVFNSEAGLETPRFLIHIEKGVIANAVAATCNNVPDGSIQVEGLGGRYVTLTNENGQILASVEGMSNHTFTGLGSGIYRISSKGEVCGTDVQEFNVPSGSISSNAPSYTPNVDGSYTFSVSVPSGSEVTWSIEGETYPGATISHVFSNVGDQAISCNIQDGQCSEVHNLTLGVTQASINENFKITPDASGNHQILVSDYSGTIQVEVLNTAGQVISLVNNAQVTDGSVVTIKTSEFSSGVYLVKIASSNGISSAKIQR